MIRFITQFLRISVGALFIFSGIVKLNDPSGFAIKLDEYFHVFSEDASATQPNIKLTLSENMVEVESAETAMYSFDIERELSINSSLEVNETDSLGRALGFEQKVAVSLDGVKVSEFKKILTDTISVHTYALQVSVDGKPIYQKSFNSKKLIANPQRAKLELKKFINENSFLVDFFSGLGKYSLWFSVIFCALEVILGFALIIGWKAKLVSWLMYLLVLFFTFLTAYSYYAGYEPRTFAYIGFLAALFYSIFVFAKRKSQHFSKLLIGLLVLIGVFVSLCTFTELCFACEFDKFKMKVTDCGCFGDFLKLKPWESFYKDIVLTISIGFILINASFIKPWFSKKFGNRLLLLFSIFTFTFGLLCYFYLPIWDFLPYKKGNNVKTVMEYLPPGERTQDSMYITFSLKKGDDSVRVPSSKMMAYMDKGFEFVPNSRNDKTVIEGFKSPIHDFTFTRNSDETDITDEILNGNDFKLIWICSDITKTSKGDLKKIKPIQEWAKLRKIDFLTSTFTGPEAALNILKANKLEEEVYRCDQKTLLTMARYNATLYLFKGPVVVNKWSSCWLPSISKLEKLAKK